jgi:hypothetical protein
MLGYELNLKNTIGQFLFYNKNSPIVFFKKGFSSKSYHHPIFRLQPSAVIEYDQK